VEASSEQEVAVNVESIASSSIANSATV